MIPSIRSKRVRKTLSASLLLVALLAQGPTPCRGQVNLVGGLVHTQDLGGQWGADLRLGIDPPALPVGVFGGVDYFPASCEKSCSLWGYRFGMIFHSSAPVIQPYLTGGYVVRERKLGSSSGKRIGIAIGGGVRTTKGIRVQVEGTWEFLGRGFHRGVFRIGLGL